MGVFADTLRQARQQKGASLKEAEQATRINRHHLSALEDENFAVLPALIYQRGIVRNYAVFLGLDPGKLLAMHEEARGGETTNDLIAAVKPIDIPTHWAPNFAIIAFMVVMGAIVFAWVYSLAYNEPSAAATVPAAVPTVTPVPADQLVLENAVPAPSPASGPGVLAAAVGPAATAGSESTAMQTSDASSAPVLLGPNPGGAATAAPPAGQAPAQTAALSPPAPLPSPTATAPPQPTLMPTPAAAPTQPPAAAVPQGPTATIRVVALGDIEVTIVADGTAVFSGWLGQGGSTDWFTATKFEVATSNGQFTQFANANDPDNLFFMGFGPNETYELWGQ
jgi:cytoskeletal protein RodZ